MTAASARTMIHAPRRMPRSWSKRRASALRRLADACYQRRMRTSVIAALVLAAGVAQAAPSRFGVQLSLALAGDVDPDTVKVGIAPSHPGSADLKDNYGIAGTWETLLANRLWIGARVAFFTSKSDDEDLNAKYHNFDVGVWGRYTFQVGPVEPFVAAALGPSYATTDPEDFDPEPSGFGYHLMVGAGASYPILSGLDLYGGLFYLLQSYSELDDTSGGLKIEVEDVAFSRFLLTVGAMF
jgi:hypothetical protein